MMGYEFVVSYPIEMCPEGDAAIEAIAKAVEVDTGAGFGQRDLYLMFKTLAEARAAQTALRAARLGFELRVGERITFFDGARVVEVQ